MLFNSIQFIVFFLTMVGLYFTVPHRWRWVCLLVGSAYFYMVLIPKYILILAVLILIDYGAGRLIESAPVGWRKFWLILSILSNVGMLVFFKYLDFLIVNLNVLLGWVGHAPPLHEFDIRLPIGLSFHVFQSLSYTIEVYRGKQKAEKHLGIYAVYVMFFPQLVAGPIERAQNLLHQFHETHICEYANVMKGLQWMLWGFFKKLVVADRLALIVDPIYSNPSQATPFELMLATYGFALQIYCDFSGYSDIAIGSAKIMGFNLMINFNQPYFSQSISEFWQRWHISLSTWFRDYVYIPLGGNRVVVPRWYFNLMLTFLVSGLWHGANWTFITWGGIHGLYLILSLLTQPLRKALIKHWGWSSPPLWLHGLRMVFVFHLVTFAWIFFRAGSLSEAVNILQGMLPSQPAWTQGMRSVHLSEFFLALGMFAFVETFQWLLRTREDWTCSIPHFHQLATGLGVGGILWLGKFTSQSFIYFQF